MREFPPLKVLLIVNRLTLAGGAEIQLTHLAVGLAGLGDDVTICCIGESYVDDSKLEGAGVKVVSLHALTRTERPRALRRLTALAREADVVQCTMWDASFWGRIAAIIARRPVVVADHATDRSIQLAANGESRAGWIALHNRLLDRFTFATVICAASQRTILLGEGVDPEKIEYIPNGIPLEVIRRVARSGPSRKELGIPEDRPVVMQVGVFRREKNQLGAIEAVKALRELVPDVQLAFVGDGDGDDRAMVEARTEALDASGWTHFLGFRDDVPAMLALADVMLLPSLSDALPITVLESMAVGVPVVATDVGDVAAALGPDAGICVPNADPEQLALACATILKDPDLRRRMSEGGTARAETFDSGQMVKSYSQLLTRAQGDTRSST